jgi:hypothetical protein
MRFLAEGKSNISEEERKEQNIRKVLNGSKMTEDIKRT